MAIEDFPLKGYTLPLTPQGHSSLVEPPPWHFGGEVMQVLFRADEKKARALVPPPLEMGPQPGQGILWFVEWVSVSDSNPDLAFINPERTVYRECLLMIQCSFQGVPGYFVPYIWVSNDFTLLRGIVQGFPKKLARIYLTKLNDLTPVIGGKRNGAKMKGICEAHGDRIVEGSLIFNRRAAPEELPKLRFYLMRHFPDIEDPARPAVHELAISSFTNFKVEDIWGGEAGLKFFESEVEEIADLMPVETMGGFYHSIGLTITGGKVIHRYQ